MGKVFLKKTEHQNNGAISILLHSEDMRAQLFRCEAVLPCKAKRPSLLTLQVSRYCLLVFKRRRPIRVTMF